MALVRCDFFSDVLEVGTSMTVVLPQQTEEQIGVPTVAEARDGFPVLYLLHGLSDDASAWLRYSAIERHAASRGLAVVMPQVGRSFYADEVHGHRYWTFLSEELPGVVQSFFRVSPRREDTYVAGLSMGGYGALKWALRDPSRFAAAASLSGALDLTRLLREPGRRELLDRVFGGTVSSQDDLFSLLGSVDASGVPRLYVGCGTEDGLLPGSERFAAEAASRGLDVRTDFRPGDHEWALWDAVVPEVVDWMLAG
jgi:S-formylglutathione hydrolase FrmB